jgi:hypothetical protein
MHEGKLKEIQMIDETGCPLDELDPYPLNGIHEGEPMWKIPVQYYNFIWQRHSMKFNTHNKVHVYIKGKIPEWEISHPGYNWK